MNSNIDEKTAVVAPRSAPPQRARGWIFALLLGVPVLAGGVAVAGPHHGNGRGGMHEHMQKRMGKVLDEVGATPQQKAQIKAIWDQAKPQLDGFRQQRRALHDQMRAAMTAPTVDAATVERLRRESVQLMDRQSTVMTGAFVGSAQVLSPEQRKQIGDKLQKHGPRFAPHDGE